MFSFVVLLNLVTRTSAIKYHPSSEIMAMYSASKENAVRLVHYPSLTVFKNFPTMTKKGHHINAIDFSPNGGFLAMGLNNGSASLYRLHHYDQY